MKIRRLKGDHVSGGWRSAGDEAPRRTGLALLREELRTSTTVFAPARQIFSEHSEGRSARLIMFGDMLADAAVTPLGRILVAALALTMAWLLI